MDFIGFEEKNNNKYSIHYSKYLELFLADNNLLHTVSSNKIIFNANSLHSLDKYIKMSF